MIRELSDVELVVFGLLEPFGFRVGAIYRDWVVIRGDDSSICVVGGVVTLYKSKGRMGSFYRSLSVELCDPGSLGVIEDWANGG